MALKKYEAQLHTSCDYVLKNFEVRQEARSTLLELASVHFDTAENEPAKSLQIFAIFAGPSRAGAPRGSRELRSMPGSLLRLDIAKVNRTIFQFTQLTAACDKQNPQTMN